MNLAMILPGVELFEAVPLRHMHVLPLALWSTTKRTNFKLSPALFVTHHTASLYLRETWDVDSFKCTWRGGKEELVSLRYSLVVRHIPANHRVVLQSLPGNHLRNNEHVYEELHLQDAQPDVV